LINGAEVITSAVEIQHTPHFVHLGSVVWVRLAFHRFISCSIGSWSFIFLGQTVLSLDRLLFFPLPLSVSPVFGQCNPLAIHTLDTTNLNMNKHELQMLLSSQNAAHLPPFDTSENLFSTVFAAKSCDDVPRRLLTTHEGDQYTGRMHPVWRWCADVRELLQLLDGMPEIASATVTNMRDCLGSVCPSIY
jgi:hypothetical protein